VKDLLDVAYFHVVFTIPDKLGQLALQNKSLVYSILFRSAAQKVWAAPKRKFAGARAE